MDKVVFICGSGDETGVSHSVCRRLSCLLESRGIFAEVFEPNSMDIRHCTGCEACINIVCPIDDDMHIIFDSVSDVDLLVLVSPIHFSGPSSITKTVMDRFQPFWHNPDLRHPARIAAILCGGSPNPCFTHTESIIKAFAYTVGMKVVGFHHISDTDSLSMSECLVGVDDFILGLIGDRKA
jgi:multimeric flavodoxin WrbA